MQSPFNVERRDIVRHAISLPVHIGDLEGTTLNLSAAGVLFESPLRMTVGETIDLRFDFAPVAADALTLHCRGRVVRTSPHTGGLRVAARFEWIEHEC